MKKDNNMKYELRLRQNTSYWHKSDTNEKKHKNKKDNFMNKSIFSVMALIVVMLMKMSSSQTAENSLEMLGSLLKKQVDYTQIGQITMEQFNSFLDEIDFLNQTQNVNSQTVMLIAPLNEAVITKDYTAGAHPLLSTETEPYGITLTSSKGAFVICGADSVVTSKTENADGTYRVVLTVSDNKALSLVYDKMAACYFNIGECVAQSQILGILPSKESEETASLDFCIYLNNEAQDPTQYIEDVYPNESK